MKKAIVFLIFGLISAAIWATDYEGVLDISGMAQLKLVLHLDKQADGSYKATLDSPDQNAFGIPAEATVADGHVKVTISSIGASLEGKLSDEKIDGSFSQGGMSLPLVMSRKAEKVASPKPYTEENVTFSHDGITLAGTLTLPKDAKNVPAVVLISGSGPQDRDETIFGHKPFAIIADSLTRHGIAVLRYDDRGVGHSSTASGYETTADFAKDAKSAYDYLATRPEVDKKRIGYIGHSEGGMIALMNGGCFGITLAAPAVKGKDLILKQNENLAKTQGVALTAERRVSLDSIFTMVDTVKDVKVLRKKLNAVLSNLPEKARNAQVKGLTDPWYRYFIQFDPTPYIKQLNSIKGYRLLALNGEWDAQVDCEQNLSVIAKTVKNATVKRYPRLNHLFQECESYSESLKYGSNPNEISPQVIADIITFILQK